jgi:hypothetical protein
VYTSVVNRASLYHLIVPVPFAERLTTPGPQRASPVVEGAEGLAFIVKVPEAETEEQLVVLLVITTLYVPWVLTEIL